MVDNNTPPFVFLLILEPFEHHFLGAGLAPVIFCDTGD